MKRRRKVTGYYLSKTGRTLLKNDYLRHEWGPDAGRRVVFPSGDSAMAYLEQALLQNPKACLVPAHSMAPNIAGK